MRYIGKNPLGNILPNLFALLIKLQLSSVRGHPEVSFIRSIVRTIRPRTELQFQIHREGWRIRIAREAEGLESYSDSPAFEMDLKLLRGPRENRPNNNVFVHRSAR